MKLSELKKYVDRYLEYERDDPEVVIQIKLPYSTVGAQPSVGVKSVQMGFDWDAGKFIITPEEPLTPSDRDFAQQMRDMQERAGWADSENRNLKAEIRRLKKKITEGSGGKYSDTVSDGGMDPRNQPIPKLLPRKFPEDETRMEVWYSMNERIRKFQKQSSIEQWDYDNGCYRYILNLEKFTELIVKECLEHGKSTQSQTVVNGSEEYNAGREMGIEVFMNQIRKHFGVE